MIVGAGPTGLSLACALADRGIDTVVLDRASQGENTSRAAVVHARTLEVLEDVGVSQVLVQAGVVVPRFTIRDRDRALISIPFAGLPTAYPYTLMVPQGTTEQILHDRLIALGGTVHREHEVTAARADTHAVTVDVAGPAGVRSQVRARYGVGCDGMRSVVREQTGIAFTGARYAQSFVLADVRMDWQLSREEVQLFFSPAGLVVVAPLPEDRYRVVATLDDAPQNAQIEDVQALLDVRGPAAQLAERYRRGRVFLAGDAAHVHSPAGGQGMNIGIQDGLYLAGLLGDAIDANADADDAILDSYEMARRPVAKDVVATTDRITRAATARGPVVRRARNSALGLVGQLAPVRHRLAMNLSGLASPTQSPTERHSRLRNAAR